MAVASDDCSAFASRAESQKGTRYSQGKQNRKMHVIDAQNAMLFLTRSPFALPPG